MGDRKQGRIHWEGQGFSRIAFKHLLGGAGLTGVGPRDRGRLDDDLEPASVKSGAGFRAGFRTPGLLFTEVVISLIRSPHRGISC